MFLYEFAGSPRACQQLKQNHCLEIIGPLIEISSTEIKVLSKALIARMIPIDAISDDMAVLTLIKDEEVEYLITLMSSQPCQTIPIISVMIDLGRSPHNLFALASQNVAAKLSEVMESFYEDDQAKIAQLIWKIMEIDYDGSENISIVSNNGSLERGMTSLCAS